MHNLGAGGSGRYGDQRQRTTEGWFSSRVGAVTPSGHPPLVARFLLGSAFLSLNFTIFLGGGNDGFPLLTCQTVPVELPLPLLQNPLGSGKGK